MRARVGVVPQLDNLDPDFTVAENLRMYASYFGLPADPRRIAALLDFAALSERGGARTETLSGGMKRRLTIARALVNDPELVVLDEPTTGLDPQARHVIWGRLADLRARGTTLILTTHYMEEAERLCDELVIMDHGRILDQGSPRALIARHVEPEVVEVRSESGALLVERDASAGCRLERMGTSLYCYTRMVPQRTYEALLATPLEVDDILAGEMLWCATKSVFSSAAILVVAALLGVVAGWQALWILPVVFLAGMCFAGPAMMMSAVSTSYDFFNYFFVLVITPMYLLCGVFYPVETLPRALQGFIQFLPLTHAVALARPLVTGLPLDSVPLHLAVLAAYAAVSYYLAVVLVRRRLLV